MTGDAVVVVVVVLGAAVRVVGLEPKLKPPTAPPEVVVAGDDDATAGVDDVEPKPKPEPGLLVSDEGAVAEAE